MHTYEYTQKDRAVDYIDLCHIPQSLFKNKILTEGNNKYIILPVKFDMTTTYFSIPMGVQFVYDDTFKLAKVLQDIFTQVKYLDKEVPYKRKTRIEKVGVPYYKGVWVSTPQLYQQGLIQFTWNIQKANTVSVESRMQTLSRIRFT
jgi:hypothetical protein